MLGTDAGAVLVRDHHALVGVGGVGDDGVQEEARVFGLEVGRGFALDERVEASRIVDEIVLVRPLVESRVLHLS